MLSESHSQASTGRSPQFVGQVESTSTNENPRPSTWFWNAYLIAFFAAGIFLGEWTDTRSMYMSVARVDSISDTLIGMPVFAVSRPNGLVVVFCPGSVVGAICPPVIP